MTTIRPMRPDDVPRAVEVQHATFAELGERIGEPMPPLEEFRDRGAARIAHLQGTDPASAWVAEQDGGLVGLSLALVRDGMWFLSLLAVAPAVQGQGIGRQLLDAALSTATDRSWILSTVDPSAVRRYQRAGFALHPTYTAYGVPDLSAAPARAGVREYDDDRATLDDVVLAVRGARMGPEVDYLLDRGSRVLVVPGRGFAVLRPQGVMWLGATDEAAARDLLWAALAEATEPLEVDWLAGDQQWAIDVCLDARLTLRGSASIARRGQPAMSPYLPSGAFG